MVEVVEAIRGLDQTMIWIVFSVAFVVLLLLMILWDVFVTGKM